MRVLVLLMSMFMYMMANDLYIISIDNKDNKIDAKVIEKALEKGGFEISANTEMNEPFMKQFGESGFKHFNLLTAYHKKITPALVASHPDSGIFVPMGFGIYQAKNDKTFRVSILSANAMEKISGIKAIEFKQMQDAALDAIKKALPSSKVSKSDKALNAEGTLFSRYVKQNATADEKDNIEMMIEEGLKPMGFVMSNFSDFNSVMGDKSPYDFYDTYSICKLKVIYNVAKTRPEAAAFAPCSLMVYKKKDSNEIVAGFPSVYNWMSSALVVDSNGKNELLIAQKDFENILESAME